MTRKVGRLINESAFVALNYVTWPIRNIIQNPRSVRSSRKISKHSLFSTNFKSYKSGVFFQMYMPLKILKQGYKPQGTDLCNPGKCWDGRRTLDMLVGMIFSCI